MRAGTTWRIGLCVCMAAAACGKKTEEAPARTVEPVAPVETPAPVEKAPVAFAPVVRPMEPLKPMLPPAATAAPVETVPPVEPAPSAETAPVEPAATGFATRTGAAGGIGVESIELCSGVEARACVGGKREFAPGEMVWALLRLTNDTQAETEVRVSYLEEGGAPAPGRGLPLRVPAQARYATFSKAAKEADGRYDVIVTTAAGEEIARAGFQVGTGEAAAAGGPAPLPTPMAPEPGAPPSVVGSPSGGSGTELGIASIELCRAIENRRCAEPSTMFAPRELVWALLRVTNPERAETELRVSYVPVGTSPAPGEGLALQVPPQERYTTFSKAGKSTAGRYEVVVCAPDGRELARAEFEVSP